MEPAEGEEREVVSLATRDRGLASARALGARARRCRALPDHTTLLISAEQVGLLSEYMLLARLLQPSIVILEDVDLIARDRANMNSPCDEVLLNKLLNR